MLEAMVACKTLQLLQATITYKVFSLSLSFLQPLGYRLLFETYMHVAQTLIGVKLADIHGNLLTANLQVLTFTRLISHFVQ